jgi:ribosomal protein S18 acetylase RimI-like enzyme
MPGITIELADAGRGDLAEILRNYERFWGDREPFLRYLNHPMFLLEFGDTAFVARRDDDGEIVGYAFGFVAPAGYGYIHLVGVREDVRAHGVGRLLYDRFTEEAVKRGATALKAITSPENEVSLAFHARMGFTDMERFEDYGGSGRVRVVMRKPLVPEPA